MLWWREEHGAQLEAWMREGYPEETCGLLVGRREPGLTRVVRVVRAPNLNRDQPRRRFDLDPASHLRVELAAREEGLGVVGVWHSHPDSEARPSKLDRDLACEGWSYVIGPVTRDGAGPHRSWRLVSGRFVEEPVRSAARP